MLGGMTSGFITWQLSDGIAHVRLTRPDKLNALSLEMLDDLIATARTLRSERAVRAVVLSGEGDAFCAGMDLRGALADPAGIATRFVPRPWQGTNTFQEACWVWRRLGVPVIAAVHGHCLGAGVQLALGADLRFTAPDAQWSVREVRWGLVPDMSGVRTLIEQVGADVAKELTMTARTVSGTEAERIGLATRAVADPIAEAFSVAAEIAVHDAEAVARAKSLFTRSWTSSARRTLARERWAQLGLLRRLDGSGLPGRSPSRSGVTSHRNGG